MDVMIGMKEFFGSFAAHLKRGVISWKFLACVGINVALMIFYCGDILDVNSHRFLPGLNYFLNQVDHSGAIYLTMMITVFPAVMLFYEDWSSGFFKFEINRAGRRRYAFSVTLAAAVTGAAVFVLSYLIFSGIVLVNFPALPELVPGTEDDYGLRGETMGFPNNGLFLNGHTFLCYALYFLTRGAMAAFFAAVGVFQSMIVTNRHLTAISPVFVYIIYYTFHIARITPELAEPFTVFRNPIRLYLIFGGTVDGSLFSPIAAVYPTLFCIAVTLILALIECKILRVKMNRHI